jgi:choice-of-anchor B domain-containing protein
MTNVRTLLTAAFVIGFAAVPAQAQVTQFGGTVLLQDDGSIMITESADPAGTGSAGSPRTIYTYSRSGSEWVQSGAIQAPPHEGSDYFGRFLLQDGDNLIIGATAIDSNGDEQSDGTVYIYRRAGNSWEYASELRPESIPLGSSYGRFGSVGGDLLVVSALGYLNQGVQNSGGAFVFERGTNGDWNLSGTIAPESPHPQQEFFGWGVHTDGERVIVGAFAGPQLPGAAYVFGRNGSGEWVQEARLALPDEEVQPGTAAVGGNPTMGVGISGNHALFGLPGAEGGTGVVLHYERRPSGNWVRTGSLAAFDRAPGDAFGAAFHGYGGELYVAAPNADGKGALYAFSWNPDTETFGSARKIGAGSGSDFGDGFGMALAMNDDVMVVGQPWDDSQLGSVVVLEREGESWEATSKIFMPLESRDLPALSDVTCSDSGSADQFACEQVDVLSFMPLAEIGGTDRGIQTNDVWGWTDPQTGREYALVGRTDGTSFIDVSNPAAPIYLGNLQKTEGSQTNSWRDIKVYQDHAFIVADGAGQHGVQVFDLKRLRDVRNAPVEFEVDALYEEVASVHNIVINEEVGRAYAVGSNSGGETCGGGLHMIDISDPMNPTFDGCFQDVNTGFAGTGYSHDAMCMTYNGPDAEHAGKEICFGSNENNLSIADVTDPDNSVALSHASYPGVAYAHQGWITPDGRYFFMNDEGDEGNNQQAVAAGTAEVMAGTRTLIWDVSDLDDPVMVKEHFGETLTIDHNLYIKDNLMYQSNYVSGLRVLDISDPENPVEVGYFDTVPWDESVTFDGSWSNYPFFESGTIVVSSGQEGVFFLKYRRPELVP